MAEEPLETVPAVGEQSQPEAKSFLPVPVLAGGIFLLVVFGAIFWLVRRPQPPPPPPPSAESLAYLPQITISEFHLSSADNMVGSVIIYLDGKVTNGGNKAVRRLRVRLFFYDTLNQVILREERDIVSISSAALAAGETRDFQLRFNRPPSSWNVQPPQFQLVSLDIE